MNRGPTELQSSQAHHVSVTASSWISLDECITASVPWWMTCCARIVPNQAPTRGARVAREGAYSLAAQSMRLCRIGASRLIAIAYCIHRPLGNIEVQCRGIL